MSISAIASKMVVRYYILPLSEKNMLHWFFLLPTLMTFTIIMQVDLKGITVLYMYNSILNIALQYSKLLSWLHVSGLQLGSAH